VVNLVVCFRSLKSLVSECRWTINPSGTTNSGIRPKGNTDSSPVVPLRFLNAGGAHFGSSVHRKSSSESRHAGRLGKRGKNKRRVGGALYVDEKGSRSEYRKNPLPGFSICAMFYLITWRGNPANHRLVF
jgi:hypothetical protein